MDALLIALSVIMFVVFMALASFANVCLMRRDDANIEKILLYRRMERQNSKQRRRPGGIAIAMPMKAAALSPSPSSASLHTIGAVPPSPTSQHPNQNTRSSRTISEDEVSLSSYQHEDDVSSEDCSVASLFVCRSTVGSADVRCWFSILVVVSSWAEGIASLVLLMSDQTDLRLSGGRNVQDLVVAPAILTVYLTFSGLLLILVYLVEKEVGGSTVMDKTVAIRLTTGVVALLLIPIIICFFLVFFEVWNEALEVYSTAMEFLLAIAFGFAGFHLPRRVMSFGQEMSSVANKIRKVCIAVAVCMTCRGVLILPPTQTALGALGGYALVFLECGTAFPLLLSLMLLHQQSSS
ncbi:membrane-associated protein, putative [Bodo saltans]|uniref:Membrane-associated protein, putative n=1 Tax=Bodo saltans TaxID=75058 RepID=B6DTA3_BODSA|nr:hypothetical protein [Bodo saltans]CUI14199.1 membrane-associated protein, putative [Bodo saltans]|eukprot:CUI14199.1 membrane-associated protein, putative [Bodo saltans]